MTAQDCAHAAAACRLLFIAPKIGVKDLSAHIEALSSSASELPELDRAVVLSDDLPSNKSGAELLSYSAFKQKAQSSSDSALQSAESAVKVHDILSLQFTSGW